MCFYCIQIASSRFLRAARCENDDFRAASVSGTVEVGSYVQTNRQIFKSGRVVGGRHRFRTKRVPTGENFQLTYVGIIRFQNHTLEAILVEAGTPRRHWKCSAYFCPRN